MVSLCRSIIAAIGDEDPQIVEHTGYAPLIPDFSFDRQTLLVIGLRGNMVALVTGRPTQVVECLGDVSSVAQVPSDRQALLEVGPRGAVVALDACQRSRSVQSPCTHQRCGLVHGPGERCRIPCPPLRGRPTDRKSTR